MLSSVFRHYNDLLNRIGGVMFSMLISSEVDR